MNRVPYIFVVTLCTVYSSSLLVLSVLCTLLVGWYSLFCVLYKFVRTPSTVYSTYIFVGTLCTVYFACFLVLSVQCAVNWILEGFRLNFILYIPTVLNPIDAIFRLGVLVNMMSRVKILFTLNRFRQNSWIGFTQFWNSLKGWAFSGWTEISKHMASQCHNKVHQFM